MEVLPGRWWKWFLRNGANANYDADMKKWSPPLFR